MEDQVHEQLCRRNTSDWCINSTRRPYLSITAIKEGTLALFKVAREKFSGKEIEAPKEEIKERVKICEKCPHNVNYHGCWSCVLLDVGLKVMMPKWKTEIGDTVKTCEVCSCILKAKAHLTKDILRELPPKDYPDHCWMKDIK